MNESSSADGFRVEKLYHPYGGAKELMRSHEPEVLLCGPSGTGKSRAALEKLNALCLKYPGLRVLVIRKTRESLTQSGLVTLDHDVIVPEHAVWLANRGEWRYRNGSRIVVAGMDKVGKIMSSEYDIIYVQEATELLEDDWEHLTTRLRGTTLPYHQIIADCNPSGSSHWLLRRAQAGKLKIIDSRHEDNPRLVDPRTGEYTPEGRDYLAKLDALTGVRYQRLRLGRWVSAEGIVFNEYDANVHLIAAQPAFGGELPPAHWPRLWSIDFGYTHPFVWQAWAKDPETEALYRFAELYHTNLLVEKVADIITAWMNRTGEEFPEAIICDHDAEGRATLRDKLGVPTIGAKKSVALGIQAVKQRLLVDGEGKARLYLIRDAGIMPDATLFEAKQPTSTEEEIELYIWEDGVKDSTPVKAHDHGMDAMRYVTMHVDKGGWSLEQIAAWGRGESSLKASGSSSAPAKPEPQPKPPEPEKPAETPEEKQRRREEEVEEMNRQALLRARGFKE